MAGPMLAQHRDQIGRKGRLVAIRRYTGPAGINRPCSDTVTKAFVSDYDAAGLVGGIKQGDRLAIALVDTLGPILPVLDTDRLVTDFQVVSGVATIVDGKVVGGKEATIKNVKERHEGADLIALEIQAAG